jgi:hypothetical protein
MRTEPSGASGLGCSIVRGVGMDTFLGDGRAGRQMLGVDQHDTGPKPLKACVTRIQTRPPSI